MSSIVDLLPPRPRVFEPPMNGGMSGNAVQTLLSTGNSAILTQRAGAEARYFDVGPALEAMKTLKQAGGAGEEERR